MKHSSEQALQAAREILSKNKIKHLEVGIPESKTGCQFNRELPVTDVWVISYTYMVFQDEIAFIYLDDLNELNLLYILTKHGYITY